MSMRTRLFASIAAAAFALALTSSAALAANGDCGQPVSNGAGPVATDCLFILQAAVGAQTCSPVCVCDLNGSGGNPNATDALSCLNASVGVPGLLNCPVPCGDTPVPPKNACSVGEFIAAAGSDLDAGWNGAGHDAKHRRRRVDLHRGRAALRRRRRRLPARLRLHGRDVRC